MTWRPFMPSASLRLAGASLFLADSEIVGLLQPTMDDFDKTFSEDWWEQFRLFLRRAPKFPRALWPLDSFFYSEIALLLCLCLILKFMRQTPVSLSAAAKLRDKALGLPDFLIFYCFFILLTHGEEQKENCLFNRHGRLTSDK